MAIEGSGVLHGLWLKGRAEDLSGIIRIYDGLDGNAPRIGIFQTSSAAGSNKFFELNVQFNMGLYIEVPQEAELTILYRSANP